MSQVYKLTLSGPNKSVEWNNQWWIHTPFSIQDGGEGEGGQMTMKMM